MYKQRKIPSAAIFRLSVYRQHLLELRRQGRRTISSGELARAARVNSAQLRKDLSYFGRFGVRGVGYNVDGLLQEISTILGLKHPWNVCVLGGGRVGRAIVMSGHLERGGYFVEAVFDSRDAVVGEEIGNSLKVNHVSRAPEIVPAKDVSLCMITEDVPGLNGCINTLLDSGIKGFLSLVPVMTALPSYVPVKHLDFTTLLDTLAYALTHGGGGLSDEFPENERIMVSDNNYKQCVV